MMDFLLVTAIIFIIGPILVIEGFALWIVVSFCREDKMAGQVLKFALGWLVAGIVLLLVYYIAKFFM